MPRRITGPGSPIRARQLPATPSTTYYIDFTNGLDANDGLGPDASSGSHKPWKTIGKALGATGLRSGDTAYLAPGTFREVVTVAMPSAITETKLLGDPGNVQGFKTSGGARVAPGPVVWSAFTTNDTTTPSANPCLNLIGRRFLTFQNILFMGGNGSPSCVNGLTATSTDCKFIDCTMVAWLTNRVFDWQVSASTLANLTIDRCTLFSNPANVTQGVIALTLERTAVDYDSAILIRNSRIIVGNTGCVRVVSSGAGTGFGGGITIRSCTLMGATGVATGDASLSVSNPVKVTGCLIIASTGLNANLSGEIVEDHNLFNAGTPRTNVSVGTGSQTTYALLAYMGQEQQFGSNVRNFLEPMAGSPLLAFGSDGSGPTVDGFNNPRPAGGASANPAAGALERSSSFGQETGTVRTGSNAISITGPGYQDFAVPVDAVSTTISCYVQRDATYAGTNPRMQVLDGEECGVAAATATAVGASGSFEQLSLTFTPTAKGIVTIRLVSSDSNGAGKMFADDFAVA